MKDNEVEHSSLAFEIIKEEKTIIKRLQFALIFENILFLILGITFFKIIL